MRAARQSEKTADQGLEDDEYPCHEGKLRPGAPESRDVRYNILVMGARIGGSRV